MMFTPDTQSRSSKVGLLSDHPFGMAASGASGSIAAISTACRIILRDEGKFLAHCPSSGPVRDRSSVCSELLLPDYDVHPRHPIPFKRGWAIVRSSLRDGSKRGQRFNRRNLYRMSDHPSG